MIHCKVNTLKPRSLDSIRIPGVTPGYFSSYGIFIKTKHVHVERWFMNKILRPFMAVQKNLWTQRVERLGLTPTMEQRNNSNIYLSIIKMEPGSWSRFQNDEEQLFCDIFVTLCNRYCFLDLKKTHIILDIGLSGFPSIPIRFSADLSIVLTDSNRKKARI